MKHNKRIIAAKLESSYGTDSTPVSTNAIQVSDLTFSALEAQTETRDYLRTNFGTNPIVLTGKHTKVDFSVEFAGSGTRGIAPAYDCLLQACALKNTTTRATKSAKVTYTPQTASTKSVVIYFNIDGVLHKMTGARGTFTLSMEVGKIPYLKFSFIGLFTQPTTTAAITPNYTAFKSPVVVGEGNTDTFNFFAVAAEVLSFNLDLGNELVQHQTIRDQQILIADRKVKASISLTAPSLDTKDHWLLATNAILGALRFVHGMEDNIITFNAPKVQILSPKYGNIDNVVTLETDLAITGTADNDFSLEYK